MSKKGFDPQVLADAEIVLMNGVKNGLALSYSPGHIPVVLAKARGLRAEELLWCAQELSLPLVDAPALSPEMLEELEPGTEIPEALYRLVAHCLALVQRTGSPTVPVRLVRTVGKAPDGLRRRLNRRVSEIADGLEVARLGVAVGDPSIADRLGGILDPYRRRLEIELGLPLASAECRVREGLGPLDFRVQLREVDFGRGKLEDPENLGPILGKLFEVVQNYGWRLLGYRETEALIEAVRKQHASLCAELFPHRLTVGGLRQILRNLLREGVSIRDLPGILEAIFENIDRTQDPDEMTEHVRGAFAPMICGRFCDSEGRLNVFMLEPGTEEQILKSLKESASAWWLDLDLDSSLKLLGSVARGLERAARERIPVVVLCSPRPRRFLRKLIEPSFPFLPVLSYAEVAPLTDVRTVGTLAI